jgi:hypothetical protein
MATTFTLYQPTTPIAIPYENGDELVHIAPWFTCSDPECPCHEGNLHVLSQDDELDRETGTHPPDCRCAWCAPDEPRYYSRADQEADQATADYYDEAQRRQETRQCSDGSWW